MHNFNQRTTFNDIILILELSLQFGLSCTSNSFKDVKFVWEKHTGTVLECCLRHLHE